MIHRIRARNISAALRAGRPTPVPTNVFRSVAGARAQFHASANRRNEIKSPFQTFVDVLKEEIQKNRELQQNVKQLQGDVDKFQDSEAMKRARDMYERARLTSSIKENPKLQAAAEELRKNGIKISDAVGEAVRSLEASGFYQGITRATAAVSSAVATSTEPIRNTEAYKAISEAVAEALDDSGASRYGGYEEKDVRRKLREKRLAKAGMQNRMARTHRIKEDLEAGSAMVLHKDAGKFEKWEEMKQTNPVLRTFASWKAVYDESENPVVSGLRSVTTTIGSWFDETETAQVTRVMRLMDPAFNMESFIRELREYIIPEVVDAYLSADREGLQQWCGEGTFNMLWATMEQYTKQGLISESKVIDIANVDVAKGTLLENNVPVFVVSFSTQEVLVFRSAKTGEVVVGAPDRVEQCSYAAVITRIEDELDNELTGGWKVVEMARRSARSSL
ncbi:import inner membrane translocase subunit TIM44 [Rhizoctonia solani AG-3 Rhs1AP]|uniref:Mitochondrial import inner membrane translocase subunit TIM44 n=2 Tax=Rhizoctonia solani AG-3 TaxID=1086053 RepID=A0A074RZX8_9AGAM|nr:import inner membrane translocase subunit TIM44 [Rhizoctonia solani AG-3 Rhs1AP]KEP52616.1 import inner membrane translocase subunit TIM44 [Rhizoctonia solani 123E]